MKMWENKWKSRKRETNNIEREREFVSHVPLLDEKAIERMVMEKKKHDLILIKYIGEYLI
jgi:hypothetical protein